VLTALKKIFPVRADGSLYPPSNIADYLYDNHAATYSNELSISGGNEKSTFYLNLSSTKQNGVFKKTGFDRKSARLNFENRLTNWFKIGMNTELSYTIQDYGGIEGTEYQIALLNTPLNPIYLEDGSYMLNYTYPLASYNPVAAKDYNINRGTSFRGISKLYGEIIINRNFKFTSNVGIDFGVTESKEKRDS